MINRYDVIGNAFKALRYGQPLSRKELFEEAGLSETVHGSSGKALWEWLLGNGFAVPAEVRVVRGQRVQTITLAPAWLGQD